jgi:hypothetical protein
LSPSREEPYPICAPCVGTPIGGFARGLLVMHVWVVAAAIPLLDKFLSLERMLRLLTPKRPFRVYRDAGPDLIARIVRRRLRRPIHMRRRACLRRSLVMYHFARLAGVDAVFHVAVFPPSVDPKRLHAHSWVTVGDACLCEPPAGQAVEMFRYGACKNSRLDFGVSR